MPAHFGPTEKDHRGEFRRKLIGGNNEIVTASEGYTNAEDADRWAGDLLRWVIEAHQDRIRVEIENAVTEFCADGHGLDVAAQVLERLTAEA